MSVQLQRCNPGIWVSPLLIPFNSETGRFWESRPHTNENGVINDRVVVLFVSRRACKINTNCSDRLFGESLTVGLLLPPRQPYVQLVRSLAFPSLQPSLVQTFSLFPIIWCTNRKQNTRSGPSAEVNITFIEAKREYLLHFCEVVELWKEPV